MQHGNKIHMFFRGFDHFLESRAKIREILSNFFGKSEENHNFLLRFTDPY